MHKTATHHAVLVPTPFASPHVVGYQPDLLHRNRDQFRNGTRRGGLTIVPKNAPSDCRYHIEAPKPDAALVAYAASLGINESGGDELGIQSLPFGPVSEHASRLPAPPPLCCGLRSSGPYYVGANGRYHFAFR